MKEYILCAAIHIEDENFYSHQPINIQSGFVITGMRHHNCFNTLYNITMFLNTPNEIANKRKNYNHTQGFLTNTNRFVDRKEAFKIAEDAFQLLHGRKNSLNAELFSEDLY